MAEKSRFTGKGDKKNGHGGPRPGSGRKPSIFKSKLATLADFYDEAIAGIIDIARNCPEQKTRLQALTWCAEMITPKKQSIDIESHIAADGSDPDGDVLLDIRAAAAVATAEPDASPQS